MSKINTEHLKEAYAVVNEYTNSNSLYSYREFAVVAFSMLVLYEASIEIARECKKFEIIRRPEDTDETFRIRKNAKTANRLIREVIFEERELAKLLTRTLFNTKNVDDRDLIQRSFDFMRNTRNKMAHSPHRVVEILSNMDKEHVYLYTFLAARMTSKARVNRKLELQEVKETCMFA